MDIHLLKDRAVVGDAGGSEIQSLYTLIAGQPFFKGLKPAHVQMLADSALTMEFAPDQEIFAEGSPANRFYLILEGTVVLEAEKEDRDVIAVQTLGPGDDLGWSWLFAPYYLHFNARALTPTKTIFFYAERLRAQCEADHEFGFQLMKRIAEVATQCLQVTRKRLMEYIDKNTLREA